MAQSIFQGALPEDGISRLMHEWTKAYNGSSPRHPGATVAEHPYFPQDVQMTLPTTHDIYQTNLKTNNETIRGRRSLRTYADRPFTLTDVSRLLTLAYPTNHPEPVPDMTQLHPTSGTPSFLRMALLAMDIEGVTPAAYLYNRQQHGLTLLRDDDPRPFVNQVCFQKEFTHAPLIIMLSASLHEIIATFGDRGYRYLLIETGKLLNRLYFVTSYLNMSSSISGSFTFGDVERWLGYDGFRQTLIISFVVGHRPSRKPDEDSTS